VAVHLVGVVMDWLIPTVLGVAGLIVAAVYLFWRAAGAMGKEDWYWR
jgi:hypothetical protein